jgi:hypothetical protein
MTKTNCELAYAIRAKTAGTLYYRTIATSEEQAWQLFSILFSGNREPFECVTVQIEVLEDEE